MLDTGLGTGFVVWLGLRSKGRINSSYSYLYSTELSVHTNS